MVAILSRSRRYAALSAVAAVAPLVASTLYVTVTGGTAFGIAALDYIAWTLIACASLPVFAVLPATRWEKLLLAVASVPANAVIGLLWGFALACFAFRSCSMNLRQPPNLANKAYPIFALLFSMAQPFHLRSTLAAGRRRRSCSR